MKLAIGADHAGLELKNLLRDTLTQAGHEVRDFGTDSKDSTDYPDYAAKVGRAVASGEAERGFLVCGSGVGMSIAANKIRGIRAALGYNEEEVKLTRQHNNANILTFGERFIDPETAVRLAKLFLETPFDGGRHERRVNKMTELEKEL